MCLLFSFKNHHLTTRTCFHSPADFARALLTFLSTPALRCVSTRLTKLLLPSSIPCSSPVSCTTYPVLPCRSRLPSCSKPPPMRTKAGRLFRLTPGPIVPPCRSSLRLGGGTPLSISPPDRRWPRKTSVSLPRLGPSRPALMGPSMGCPGSRGRTWRSSFTDVTWSDRGERPRGLRRGLRRFSSYPPFLGFCVGRGRC